MECLNFIDYISNTIYKGSMTSITKCTILHSILAITIPPERRVGISIFASSYPITSKNKIQSMEQDDAWPQLYTQYNHILPLVPPVRRNAIIERTTPNISIFINVCTLPVFGSGLRISTIFPRDIMISCCLVPEKLP